METQFRSDCITRARMLPTRPCLYSTMPLPALSTNASRRTCVPARLPCGSILAMSGPWAFQPPLTDGHVRPFIPYIALFSAPSTHPSATNKRRCFKCSRAKHTSRAALPCNFVLACHERTIWRANFAALSALFYVLSFQHRKSARASCPGAQTTDKPLRSGTNAGVKC